MTDNLSMFNLNIDLEILNVLNTICCEEEIR